MVASCPSPYNHVRPPLLHNDGVFLKKYVRQPLLLSDDQTAYMPIAADLLSNTSRKRKEYDFETVKEEKKKKGAAESVKLFSPPSAFNVTIRLLFFRVGQPIKTPPPPPPPPPPSGLKILFQLNIYIIIFRIEKAWRFLLLGPPGSIHFLFIVCRPEKKRSFH